MCKQDGLKVIGNDYLSVRVTNRIMPYPGADDGG